MTLNIKEFILIAIAIIMVLLFFLLARPIEQQQSYHRFADKRTFLGVPNCLNVISNIPFVIIGLMGGIYVVILIARGGGFASLISYMIFFAGVFLTGFGSVCYHLNPNNETLVWDRLAMTIVFSGFFCLVLSEQISVTAGVALLLPLLILGLFSVFYWKWTEDRGRGDLRLYGVVQFLPLLLTPLILVMYDGPADFMFYIVALLICYLFAKLFEALDSILYSFGNMVSGHTLKHLFAAAGAFCPLLMLYARGMPG